MLTGLYPRNHRLIINGMALPESIPTVTTLLANSGYHTHGVGKQHLQPLLAPGDREMPDSRAFWNTPESTNWDGPYYGYQSIDLLLGESDTANLAGHYANWLRENHPQSFALLDPSSAVELPPGDLDEIWKSAIPVEYHYNTWITDRAIDYLQAHHHDLDRAGEDIPFFLFISYPDPHHPFDPPAEYAERYNPDEMPLPKCYPGELSRMPPYYGELYPKGQGFRELYWAGKMDMEAGSMITTDDISDNSMRKAIAYTYAMIEMIDDGVGRILSTLDQCNAKDNTYVIFTSDHGELLGDHGLLHKGPPPYRQLTEVSMLINGPEVRAGETIEALTSHIDLAPTILELAEVSSDNVTFDGLSMVPLLSGAKNELRSCNFGEYHPSARPDLYNQTVSTDNWRLTLYPEQPEWGELFDLEADPEEHVNLFFDPSQNLVKNKLSKILANRFPPQATVDNEWLCKW
jgi:arylsulfatase A-like enzyme